MTEIGNVLSMCFFMGFGIFLTICYIGRRVINGINRMGHHLVETQNKVEQLVVNAQEGRPYQWDTWEDF